MRRHVSQSRWLTTDKRSRDRTASEPANTPSATTGGQDVAILFATRIGIAILGLLVQIALAWTLLPEGRGSYAVCVLFGLLLGAFFAPGATSGAQYVVMTRQASMSQGVSSALAIVLAGGASAAGLGLLLIHGDFTFFHQAEARSFRLALVVAPLAGFSAAVEHLLAALRRFGRIAVFSMLRVATNALALLVLVRGAGLGVDGAIVALAASHCVVIAAGLLDLRRHVGLRPEMPSHANLRRILGYGLRVHVTRIVGRVDRQIGVLALGFIAGAAEIGLFSTASVLMFGFVTISQAVGGALLPRIAVADRAELAAGCLRLVCGATAAALLAFLAASAPLARLLLPESFLPVVPLLRILAPGILAYACANVFVTYFNGVDRPQTGSWTIGFGVCVSLGALFSLYPEFGLRGAAWAVTTGMTCRCVLLAVMFRRRTGMRWRSIWWPRPSDAGFLLAAGRTVLARRIVLS